MSAQQFLKANCQHCGGHIEFPADGLGLTVACPHCQGKTVLKEAEPPSRLAPTAPVPASASVAAATTPPTPARSRPVPPPPAATGSTIPAPPADRPGLPPETTAPASNKSKALSFLFVVIGLLAIGAVGFYGYKLMVANEAPDNLTPPPAATQNPSTSAAETARESGTGLKSSAPKTPKSRADLKASPVILEKSRGGSSLVYAVGTISNESDHQRFGVKVEVDILDGKGQKVGKATDYLPLLEPREQWRFHALILEEEKAKSARIASIEEQEE